MRTNAFSSLKLEKHAIPFGRESWKYFLCHVFSFDIHPSASSIRYQNRLTGVRKTFTVDVGAFFSLPLYFNSECIEYINI